MDSKGLESPFCSSSEAEHKHCQCREARRKRVPEELDAVLRVPLQDGQQVPAVLQCQATDKLQALRECMEMAQVLVQQASESF